MWIFSTREVAVIIYTVLFVIICLFDKKIRSSLLTLLKTALTTKLVNATLIFLIYASIFVFIFTFIPIWKWIYLKDIVIWVIFAGIPLCFKSITVNIGNGYFRDIIRDQLKFLVVVEFIISSFTFNLVVELILVLVTTFITIIDLIAGAKKEYKNAKKLTTSALAVIGILIFIFTLKNIIKSQNSIIVTDMLVSFLIPIVYMFLFIPAAYLFAIYAKYESLFIRMSFKEPNNRKARRCHRWEVIKACKLSYRKIDIFNQKYMVKMFVSMSDDSFHSLISDFRENNAV